MISLIIIINISLLNRPSETKPNDDSNEKSVAKVAEPDAGNTVKPVPEKETGTTVDFDLALDYEEMDAPHSDNEVESKEDTNSANVRNSQKKSKDDENGESSDDSSGRGITKLPILRYFLACCTVSECL